MNKKEYYEEIKRKIASDGKSHQSVVTKDGLFIDGKLYREPTPIIRDGKSHIGIRRSNGELCGWYGEGTQNRRKK